MHRKEFISKMLLATGAGALLLFNACESVFDNDSAYQVNESKCTGCGDCVKSCSHNAISLSGGVATISSSSCTSCGNCVKSCKHGAISN